MELFCKCFAAHRRQKKPRITVLTDMTPRPEAVICQEEKNGRVRTDAPFLSDDPIAESPCTSLDEVAQEIVSHTPRRQANSQHRSLSLSRGELAVRDEQKELEEEKRLHSQAQQDLNLEQELHAQTKSELEESKKQGMVLSQKWKKAARELGKATRQFHGRDQLLDIDIRRLAQQLRYDMTNFVMNCFDEVPKDWMPLRIDLISNNVGLGPKTVLSVLESQNGRIAVVQSFLWRWICLDIFQCYRWAAADISKAMVNLQFLFGEFQVYHQILPL